MNRHKHHRTRQYGGRGDDEYGGWRGRDEDGEEDGYGGRGDNERWEDGGYEPEADQTVEARPTEDPRPVDDLPIATEQTEKAQTSQRQATTANSPASAQNSPSTSSTLSLTSSASPSPATARPSSLSTFHDLDIDDPSSSTTSRRMAASNNLTSSSGPTQVATVTQQTGFSATSDEGTLGVSAYGDGGSLSTAQLVRLLNLAGDYSIEADSSATSMSRNSDLSDTLSQSSTSSSTSTAATVEALPQVNEDKSVNGAMVAGSIIGAGEDFLACKSQADEIQYCCWSGLVCSSSGNGRNVRHQLQQTIGRACEY